MGASLSLEATGVGSRAFRSIRGAGETTGSDGVYEFGDNGCQEGNAWQWVAISRGSTIPADAVLAGTTQSDGHTYVGRYQGEAGKINLKEGRMHNFWAHSSGDHRTAEILVCHASTSRAWLSLRQGEPIPEGALPSGTTETDEGLVYVGRFNGEAGKINANESGEMANFWGHYWHGHKAAEILVVGKNVPDFQPSLPLRAGVAPRGLAPSAEESSAFGMQHGQIRVLQFNIWQEGNEVAGGLDKIADVIVKTQADVVALSEVRNWHSKDFHESIKIALADRGCRYHGYFVEGGDVGLLSRWPIEKAEQVTKAKRSTITAYHLQTPRRICVCSAHLDWKQYALNLPRGYDGNTFRKLNAPITSAAALHDVDEASGRGQAVRDFVAYCKSSLGDQTAVILAGDFNECSHLDWTEETKDLYGHNGIVMKWKHSITLQDAGFRDSWREIYPDPVTHLGATWPSQAFKRKCTSWAITADERDRIDFIYHNACGLRTLSSVLVGSKEYYVKGELAQADSQCPFLEDTLESPWPSDHKALLTEFEFTWCP